MQISYFKTIILLLAVCLFGRSEATTCPTVTSTATCKTHCEGLHPPGTDGVLDDKTCTCSGGNTTTCTTSSAASASLSMAVAVFLAFAAMK
eukprot:GHVL01042209.1.p1 GENE.GHVL01042209.1~~GHVL01042209.1.p1  ORF type:complete len:106 (-),score=6.43 GHVL01042209.1:122-394(-)